MESLRFEEQEHDNWYIVKALGRIDTMTAPHAADTVLPKLEKHDKLALDLADLDYISSAGLRVLLQLAKQAKATGKVFALVGAAGMVQEVLEESGMDVLFTMYASETELP
jgi:anti-sigma B factor antagonist